MKAFEYSRTAHGLSYGCSGTYLIDVSAKADGNKLNLVGFCLMGLVFK